MAIEQVQAYQISGGACFATADEAYAEDIKALIDTLPAKEEWLKKLVASQWPSSKKEFRKLVQAVRAWLGEAESSLAQMSGDGEKKE